jgi:hypothetical protein
VPGAGIEPAGPTRTPQRIANRLNFRLPLFSEGPSGKWALPDVRQMLADDRPSAIRSFQEVTT